MGRAHHLPFLYEERSRIGVLQPLEFLLSPRIFTLDPVASWSGIRMDKKIRRDSPKISLFFKSVD
jgi:hypothetical protein